MDENKNHSKNLLNLTNNSPSLAQVKYNINDE